MCASYIELLYLDRVKNCISSRVQLFNIYTKSQRADVQLKIIYNPIYIYIYI